MRPYFEQLSTVSSLEVVAFFPSESLKDFDRNDSVSHSFHYLVTILALVLLSSCFNLESLEMTDSTDPTDPTEMVLCSISIC